MKKIFGIIGIAAIFTGVIGALLYYFNHECLVDENDDVEYIDTPMDSIDIPVDDDEI